MSKRIESFYSIEIGLVDSPSHRRLWRPSEWVAQTDLDDLNKRRLLRVTAPSQESLMVGRLELDASLRTQRDILVNSVLKLADSLDAKLKSEPGKEAEIQQKMEEVVTGFLLARAACEGCTQIFKGVHVVLYGNPGTVHTCSDNVIDISVEPTQEHAGRTFSITASKLGDRVFDATGKDYGNDVVLRELIFSREFVLGEESGSERIWRKGKEVMVIQRKLGSPRGTGEREKLLAAREKLVAELLRMWFGKKNNSGQRSNGHYYLARVANEQDENVDIKVGLLHDKQDKSKKELRMKITKGKKHLSFSTPSPLNFDRSGKRISRQLSQDIHVLAVKFDFYGDKKY